MKKTFFTALRAMCVGAMTLFAVSCYDDSYLREDLAELEDEVAGLAARLDSLESKLNAEVVKINEALTLLNDETLAALVADVEKANELLAALDEADGVIDGRINDLEAALAQFKDEAQKQLAEALAAVAVTSVEKNEAGNYVLTFADGATLEVAAAGSTVNTGLVTTVEGEDGLLYWAVIGADGELTVLEAVVHPDTKLEFRVDPETNELLVSYDGSVWEQTGVIVNDESTINVVTSFVDGEDYVTITVGGVEYQLPKYADFSAATLSRTEAYFAYGVTKTTSVEVADGFEAYVMSKPDGWKAELADGVLTVTAPAEDLVKTGAADAKGQVLVHVNAASGACTVLKLDVSAGPSMSASYADGNLTFFSTKYTATEEWDGFVWYEWVQVWAGLTPVEEYFQYDSFASFVEDNQWGAEIGVTNVLSNILQENAAFVEGVNEELTATISMTELLEQADYYGEFDPEKAYIMWFVPNSTTGWGYDLEEAFFIYVGNGLEVLETAKAYNNVSLEAMFAGADAYYVGASSKSKYDDWGLDDTYTYEDALMQELIGNLGEGPLTLFNNGDYTAMGEKFVAGKWNFDLSDVMVSLGGGMGMWPSPGGNSTPSVEPDTEYFIWVLPYYANKSEYTFEDVVLYTVKTEPLVFNENLKAVVSVDEYTSNSALITITPPEGGTTKFELISAAAFDENYKEDGAVSLDLILEAFSYNGWALEMTETIPYGEWEIEPGTVYYLITYNEKDGEYSVEYSIAFTTPAEAEFETPANKQWLFTSEYMDMMVEGSNSAFCFDLGVAWADLPYEALAGATVIAVDYGTVPEMMEQGAPVGSWYPAFPSYGVSTVTPADASSGVVEWLGMSVPYSDFDGQVCTFDFSELMGEDAGTVLVNSTLATDFIQIQAQ